jgi:hypothetical protein
MKYSNDAWDEFTRRLLYSGSELRDYNRGKANPRWPKDESPWPSIICWLIGVAVVATVSYYSLQASPW